MSPAPRKLNLDGWDRRYAELLGRGLQQPWYGGPLRRLVERDLNYRLNNLQFDDSPAALRLWNFLLTENDRLHQARAAGDKIVGTMKDLGTIPVMAYSLPGLRAFYPDGAWWTPCLMEGTDKLLLQAGMMGIDASFCPVRAMLAAFQNCEHFPLPALLICSTGAVCDDFSAIAQRLEHLGHPILWWEIPRRRQPAAGENSRQLPGHLRAPASQVDCVRMELERIAAALAELAGTALDDARLAEGIRMANRVRRLLADLRQTVYAAPAGTLPALEMLVAEMLAIHYCSDRGETIAVLQELLTEARNRLRENRFVTGPDAVRVYWVNPVADLRAMNLLEDCGARLAGTDFMFAHALDLIPEDLPPMDALARMALADPMVGSAIDRAARVVRECQANRAEAIVVSRIPGASHCAREGEIIREIARHALDVPVVELEVPSISDALSSALVARLQAMVETARARRSR